MQTSEVEFSRTSLASRTSSRTFLKSLVLASKSSLGLASKPQVFENCYVLSSRTALFFEWLKCCKKFFLIPYCGDRLKTFFAHLNFFVFGDRRKRFFLRPFFRTLALVSLVLGLGLKHFCPWHQEGLCSEGLSLTSDMFCVFGLGLEPCVLDSTSGKHH